MLVRQNFKPVLNVLFPVSKSSLNMFKFLFGYIEQKPFQIFDPLGLGGFGGDKSDEAFSFLIFCIRI